MEKIGKILLLVILMAGASSATVILYDLVELGVNRWEYQYTVVNADDFDIHSITISFNSAEFSDLLVSSLSVITDNWDEIFLPGAGQTYYDALALNDTKISMGESLSGFAVTFTYSGEGLPGSQQFEIYDPDDYSDPLTAGWTAPIPEPATLFILSAGLVGFAVKRR